MSIEFYKDNKEEHRWRIADEDADGVTHACHEGFSSKYNALQNLFINHAMMSIFVAALAQGDRKKQGGNVYFGEGKDEKIRWKIKADNGEIVGQAHKGFDDVVEAIDNLLVTYTMLTVFVAQVAQAKAVAPDS